MNISLSMMLLWASLTFYAACFLPQLWTNYRIKSACGMSDWFIWCYFTDYFFILLYVWCQPFAYPYRIMVPIEACLMAQLVLQRFYYDGVRKSIPLVFAIVGSVLSMAGVLFLVPTHGQLIADISGWAAFGLFTVSQIPQIIKIFKSKSTYGFSFWFVSIFAMAQVCELIGGLIEKVPAATIVMCVRGLAFYLIYVYLFVKYRKKDLDEWIPDQVRDDRVRR